MIRNDSEFLQIALNSYDNPHLSFLGEFESDLKRFTYINTLVTRYRETEADFKPNLIINHLIILENCFSLQTLLKMIEYKILPENKSIIETILFSIQKIDFCPSGVDYNLLGRLNEE